MISSKLDYIYLHGFIYIWILAQCWHWTIRMSPLFKILILILRIYIHKLKISCIDSHGPFLWTLQLKKWVNPSENCSISFLISNVSENALFQTESRNNCWTVWGFSSLLLMTGLSLASNESMALIVFLFNVYKFSRKSFLLNKVWPATKFFLMSFYPLSIFYTS